MTRKYIKIVHFKLGIPSYKVLLNVTQSRPLLTSLCNSENQASFGVHTVIELSSHSATLLSYPASQAPTIILTPQPGHWALTLYNLRTSFSVVSLGAEPSKTGLAPWLS